MPGTMAFKRKTGRRAMGAFAAIAVAAVVWLVLWSRQGAALQEVAIGRDACSHCGMVVSDRRYATSVLGKDEHGHPLTKHYDDVGCFLRAMAKQGEARPAGVAYDHGTGEPIPLEKARFVKGEFDTPMGSGWVVSGSADAPYASFTQALAQLEDP
jgi:hypothetical protein